MVHGKTISTKLPTVRKSPERLCDDWALPSTKASQRTETGAFKVAPIRMYRGEVTEMPIAIRREVHTDNNAMPNNFRKIGPEKKTSDSRNTYLEGVICASIRGRGHSKTKFHTPRQAMNRLRSAVHAPGSSMGISTS